MKKYLPVLKKCSLFRHIGEEDLLRMLTCLGARVAHFDKKYTILAEGKPAKYIGILLSGSAQLSRVDYYGSRSILSKAEPADVFGEAFACAEVPSLPIAVIADDPCEVMFIDCMHILHTCSNNCSFHQQLIFNLMQALAEKNIALHQKIQVTSQRTTRDKLMTYLQMQEQKANSHTFTIPFDRQELADFLKVDRSGLSAEISKLRNEGVLESRRKEFTLL